MRILIHAIHYPVCSARYAVDAFKRLGHEVYHIGEETGRNIWGMQVPAEYEWKQDSGYIAWVSKDLKFDLNIVMDSHSSVLDNHGFKFVEEPVVVWGVDSHVRDYRRPYFNAYFLAHKSVSIQPYDENTFWLPCAYDPVAFPPSPIPWEQREYDVCCLGFMYERRWKIVNAMREAGLKVVAGCGMVYDQYRDIHHNSRVALVSSFNHDLPIRTFEGAGMGCAVLSDETPDLRWLDPQAPIVQCMGDPDGVVRLMVEEAQRLQSEPEVAEACQQWAASHTWDHRAQVIVNWFTARNGGAA